MLPPASLSSDPASPGPVRALVVGGGIGGLAAAVACVRRGWPVQLHEQAARFTELGAGVQLGPNVTRRLAAWGLLDALNRVSVQPRELVVRSAVHGGVLASRGLQHDMLTRYGAPYLTVHRAGLHHVLLEAARRIGDIDLVCGSRVCDVGASTARVTLHHLANAPEHAAGTTDPTVEAGQLLLAADGLWSCARRAVIDNDPPPGPTGHVAYRSLALQAALPASLRSADVTVWLGPRLHAVRYPVIDPRQGGLALNWVLVVHQADLPARVGLDAEALRWDEGALPHEWADALSSAHADLRRQLEAMPHWQRWTLHDREPLRSAAQMARGRIALLGDAAHPMRPYLAQGAGMAIEDAFELEACLGLTGLSVPQQLQRYAQARWPRNARVQQRSRRNGRIFHATGPMRWGRDAALRTLGARLLDQSWLYRG